MRALNVGSLNHNIFRRYKDFILFTVLKMTDESNELLRLWVIF